MGQVRRRDLLLAFAALLAMPLVPLAQSRKVGSNALRRVAVLGVSTRAKEEPILKPFYDGMRELGWIEGKNIAYERAHANDDHSRLPSLAADLIKREPEVIFAPPVPAALAATRATRTIPVVFSVTVDPVGLGLVKSLARPEGNVTGVTFVTQSLSPKRLEMLKEVLPKAERIGLLFDPNDASSRLDRDTVEKVRVTIGLTFIDAPIGGAQELDAAITALLTQTPDAVVMLAGTLVFNLRHRVLPLLARAKTPLIAGNDVVAVEGALFSYGPSLRERLHRAAYYVNRLLRGAKTSELPVEQLSRLELVVNLKTAKDFGIKVPQSVLLRADRVIE